MAAKKNISGSLCPGIKDRIDRGETLTGIASSMGVVRSSVTKLLKKNGYTTGHRSVPEGTREYILTDRQNSILLGDMFGDGGLVSRGPKTAYYQCAHCRSQKSFVDWKYDILSPLSCKRGFDASSNYFGQRR